MAVEFDFRRTFWSSGSSSVENNSTPGSDQTAGLSPSDGVNQHSRTNVETVKSEQLMRSVESPLSKEGNLSDEGPTNIESDNHDNVIFEQSPMTLSGNNNYPDDPSIWEAIRLGFREPKARSNYKIATIGFGVAVATAVTIDLAIGAAIAVGPLGSLGTALIYHVSTTRKILRHESV